MSVEKRWTPLLAPSYSSPCKENEKLELDELVLMGCFCSDSQSQVCDSIVVSKSLE